MNSTKYLIILLFIVLSITADAQLKRTMRFYKNSEVLSFCGESIILDSLGYFFKEDGCEGVSQISFGRYKVSKDNIVTFQPLSFDSLQAIRQIKRTKAINSNDSMIIITLYDFYNNLITSGANVEAIDVNGRSTRINVNKEGKVLLNRNIHKDIIFSSLLWIFKKSSSIVQGDEVAIDVYLGLPDLFLWQTIVTPVKEKQFKLMLKQNGLYKLNGKTKAYPILN